MRSSRGREDRSGALRKERDPLVLDKIGMDVGLAVKDVQSCRVELFALEMYQKASH